MIMNIHNQTNGDSGLETLKCHTAHPQTTTLDRQQNRKPRIAFYSHDTMGMGHLRRNMLIASSLSRGECKADTLLIAGTREAGFFAEQAGLDCVTLPALTKHSDGQYTARHYNWSLEETTRLRGRVIASTLLAFRPDILVVDKLPQGICNELQRTLKLIRSRVRTHCVLGLRDVLDEPDVSIREWSHSDNDQIIEKYFDEIWVYGDPSVYDCRVEYRFAQSTLDRMYFTGYLDQKERCKPVVASKVESHTAIQNPAQQKGVAISERPSKQPLALCVVGGGQDGVGLARAFIEGGLPYGWRGAVITGPFMPASDKLHLMEVATAQANSAPIEIIDRLVEADDYVSRADRIVAMGGYNTVMSVLSFRKPALIVPRTRPRAEQWLRADRLAKANLLTTLHPDQLCPEAIRDWLLQDNVANPMQHNVDLDGLERIQARVMDFARRAQCTV